MAVPASLTLPLRRASHLASIVRDGVQHAKNKAMGSIVRKDCPSEMPEVSCTPHLPKDLVTS